MLKVIEDLTRDPSEASPYDVRPRFDMREDVFSGPLQQLFPVLLRYFASPVPEHRKFAVLACNHFIVGKPPDDVIGPILPSYIQVRQTAWLDRKRTGPRGT